MTSWVTAYQNFTLAWRGHAGRLAKASVPVDWDQRNKPRVSVRGRLHVPTHAVEGDTARRRQPWPAHFWPMSQRALYWVGLLLSSVLAGCAAAPHAVGPQEAGCEQEPASFEEVCQQQSTLLAVCEGVQCAAYRCREVAEYLKVGQLVRTRWARPPQPTRPPDPHTRREVGTAWGSPQEVPQPVLIIPWSPSAQPLLPPGKVLVLESQEPPRGMPYEKHHIYPQATDLKLWFEGKGIDIHQWTLALEVEEHRRIHRGPNGGPWNEAWRKFRDANLNATKLEIELHAGKLIYEFNLYGVVVPYSRQLLRLPSNVLDPD
ncbi:MAG TPA: TIGR02269 family lipoprotein [Myxococcaceae bacterium]|jgi:uncharacterized lipoprotein (TIGR02269 family)